VGKGKEMKICAVIPAFNEEGSIARVVKGVRDFDADVIVIDDGSTDDTLSKAQALGAHIIRHNKRSGKGLSLRDGFEYALGRNYDLIFTIDGDGQHSPSDMKIFLDRLLEKKSSVVIGNRMVRPQGMPAVRVFTNKFMSFVISRICHQCIPDTQCGYRLFTDRSIRSINIRSRKFEIESEILVKLSRAGMKIDSVEIESIYADEKSSIRPIRDSFRFLRFLLRVIFKSR
jgi:glycosyltransferase involved in cell wall biosynthesis